jgi:hypothetical protein
MLFLVSWFLSFLALVGLAVWIGGQTGKGILGILIDQRGRYSLTHFQLVLWTIVILSSAIGVLISSKLDATKLVLPPELLALMGISAGSAVLSTGVKATKDALGSTARVARAGDFKLSTGAPETITPHLAQIWLEEEGDLADKVVSITKYQNFIFTLVILCIYVALAVKEGGLPALPESVVWLIGISHAGYVGGKVPNKQ